MCTRYFFLTFRRRCRYWHTCRHWTQIFFGQGKLRIFFITGTISISDWYFRLSRSINHHYYSFKIFPCFWLDKTTRIIHHNQRLTCHIEPMTSKWRHRFKQNGGNGVRKLYSFHGEVLSKNIARTARSQLVGQHLLFGVYLKTWADLFLPNFPKKMHYRCELNIDRGTHF